MKQTSHGRYTVASATKKKKPNIFVTIMAGIGSMLAIAVCVPILVVLIGTLVLSAGNQSGTGSASAAGMAIMDKFDMAVTNEISKALDGIITIEKSYWLDDEVLVAPEAVYDHFGTADSPAELAWLLEETAELVGDQQLMFNMDTPVWEHDKIYYYYDETILALAWKQKIEGCIFTIAEIKVKDASVLCNKSVIDRLVKIAKEKGYKYQYEILTAGGTDTSAVQKSGIGVKVGALSIPTRYIHSGVETIDLGDCRLCVELALAYLHSDKKD